jgi:glyoxylase-like metal-dependent hydrolase (beta-lactamase superfamily II)
MMKRVLFFVIFVLSLDGFCFDYKLTPKKVSDGIWCFFGALEGPSKKNAGNMVNTCYVETKDSFVVIDSGPSFEYAKQAYEKMKKIKNLPVKSVISTHDHDDHWLGNSFYKEKFSATIYGPGTINTNYKPNEKTRMFRVLPSDAIKGTKIIKVDKIIDKATKLNMGGMEFEIIPIKRKAHTSDDLFVYIPSKKAIFAGDLVMNGRITSNRDGSLLGQIKAIEMIESKDWDILVAGHGYKTGKDAISEAKEYFTLMYKRLKKALKDEVDPTDITKVVKMEEFKDKAMFDLLNSRNVAEAYEELEFAEE